ncbi:MAG: TolC family protein [Lentisphaerae bacterium]|nr:TolC family protein [Lentisphaerota bacterium]
MRNIIRLICLVPAAAMMPCLIVGCSSVKAPQSAAAPWAPPAAETNQPVCRQAPRAVPAGPASLAELVLAALSNSPTTVQAWQAARAAEAARRQATSQYYPSLEVSGQASEQKSDATGQDIRTTSYGPAANLTWLLLDAGGRGGRIESAEQELVAANFNYNRAWQDLLRDVASAYYALYSAQASVQAARDNVEATDKTYQAARQKEAAGLATRLDVLTARSDYEESLSSLESAKGAALNARGSLAVAVGLPADTELQIAPPSGEPPTRLTQESVRALVDSALGLRPDVAARRANLNAKLAEVQSANSGLWPSLSVGAQAGKTWNSYDLDSIEDNDSYTYMGYLALKWQIFDGFLTVAKKRKAQAEAEAARAALMASELAASSDVWSSYQDFQTAIQKYAFSKAYLESSKESYDLALEGYDAGLKSILDLLNAQSKLSSARNQMIQNEKDLYMALVKLAHAAGRITVQDVK